VIAVYDIGTTVLKGALMTRSGEVSAIASRTLSLSTSADGTRYEAGAGEWKRMIRSITRELFSTGVRTERVEAAVISGNGPTLVPVAADGTFLEPVMSWMDRRGTEESAAIQKLGGGYIDPTFYLPKALWIARNRPEVYQKTRYFLSCPESVVYWLTGVPLTVLPGEHFERYFWNSELLSALQLDWDGFSGGSCRIRIAERTEDHRRRTRFCCLTAWGGGGQSRTGVRPGRDFRRDQSLHEDSD